MAETLETLPALAKHIAEGFPELEGRSIAVSEVVPFKDKSNIPKLPLAVVALVKETAEHAHNQTRATLSADIMLEFVFEPVRYSSADGKDTPFYAYYNYESLRDRLMDHVADWRSPDNGSLSYKSLEVESDELAVYISFRFSIETNHRFGGATEATPLKITLRLETPFGCIPVSPANPECPD